MSEDKGVNESVAEPVEEEEMDLLELSRRATETGAWLLRACELSPEEAGVALLQALVLARALVDDLSELYEKQVGGPATLVEAATHAVWARALERHDELGHCVYPDVCPLRGMVPPPEAEAVVQRYLGYLEGLNQMPTNDLVARAYYYATSELGYGHTLDRFVREFGGALIRAGVDIAEQRPQGESPLDQSVLANVMAPLAEHRYADVVLVAKGACEELAASRIQRAPGEITN